MFFNNLSPLIKSSAAALCLAFCSLESAQADIALRVSGTVSKAGAGYTEGQEVSMTIKLNPAYVGSAHDSASSWMMYFDGGEYLFDLEGTGINGSLADYVNPSSYLDSSVDNEETIPMVFFWGYFSEPSPFTVNGYGVAMYDMHLTSSDFNFEYPQFTDPTTYWANYLGTYELLPVMSELSIYTVNGPQIIFNFDTLEIIPEPNSVLLLALGAGALALRRKRLAVRG